MPKKLKTEICPNCRTLNPLVEYHYRFGLEEQRYRYPDRQRLYAGFEVVEVLGYFLDRAPYSEAVALEDFDAAFAEWLEWKGEDGDSESKQTSDNSWLSRRRTHFRKRARLRCGCSVTIELARQPSADHLYIENVSQPCAAHASIGGYAMDMRGRCYVCEWPITSQAKSVDTKMNRYDPTYQAVEIEMKTHRELYPEQYSDPRIGKKARLRSGREVTIERFVPSRFGPLMIAVETGGEEAWSENQFEVIN